MSNYIRWVLTKDGKEQALPTASYLDCWIDWVGCTDQTVAKFWERVKQLESEGYAAIRKDYSQEPETE